MMSTSAKDGLLRRGHILRQFCKKLQGKTSRAIPAARKKLRKGNDFMKKQNVFLLFTGVAAFLFAACSSELREKAEPSAVPGTVVLSVANGMQRTISPAAGISYKSVAEWQVTFRDTTEARAEKYDDIIKTLSVSDESSWTVQLPLGTFAVIFEGTAEYSENNLSVLYYGESTVTVAKDTPAAVSVFVAPKKSGSGRFSYTVSTSGFENSPPATADNGNGNRFTAKLIPYAQGAAVVPCEAAVKLAENGIYTLALSKTAVPSGFYRLSIVYTYETGEDEDGNPTEAEKEIFYPYHDFLVEIIDGLETTGTADITVSLDDSKTYYATNGTSKGNGAFKSMPAQFDELLGIINATTVSVANIYYEESEPVGDNNPPYPEIDVSKVNADGKTYNIYLSGANDDEQLYTITGRGDGSFPAVRTYAPVTLKDSSSSAGKALISADRDIFLTLKNNTSIVVDNLASSLNIIIQSVDDSSYYAQNPCVTVKNAAEKPAVSYEGHTVVRKTSGTETEYYIISTASTSPGTTGIPVYSLAAVKKNGAAVTNTTPLYAGETVTITATPQDGAFSAGTTFEWFVNGEQVDCSENAHTDTFGASGSKTVSGANTFICLAKYNGAYAAEIITLTATEVPVVLYNNTSPKADGTQPNPRLSYATLSDLSSPTSSLTPTPLLAYNENITIRDYCFDASNNLYALILESGSYSIKKYSYKNSTYTGGITYECNDSTVSSVDYLEAADDGTLYAAVTVTETETENYSAIAKLTLTDPADTLNGTVTFETYTLPTTSSDTCYIQTFCVSGETLYIITYTTSSDYSTSETLLASYSVSGSTLTKITEVTPIVLAKIVVDETQNETYSGVFPPSEYNADLEYRDLCCINGTDLYLLVRDVVEFGGNGVYSSRGAVCRFSLADNNITQKGDLVGWQTEETTISLSETSLATVYIGSDTANLFYGPIKFIARKEDELIIADDGYYSDASNSAGGITKTSKNSIVTFDLGKSSITEFISLDSEYFDFSPCV